MKNKLSEQLIEEIEKLAKKQTCHEISEEDGSNIYDLAGGNFDDAHGFGMDDGQIYLARRVLKALHE
jgi:hypothetical protein